MAVVLIVCGHAGMLWRGTVQWHCSIRRLFHSRIRHRGSVSLFWCGVVVGCRNDNVESADHVGQGAIFLVVLFSDCTDCKSAGIAGLM